MFIAVLMCCKLLSICSAKGTTLVRVRGGGGVWEKMYSSSSSSSRSSSWATVQGAEPSVCFAAAAAAKSLQLWRTLCDPIDCSLPGSAVPGILQARTLEWVAISFSSAWKWKVKVKSLHRVWLIATLWTAAHQAPPSMGVSRQEYWSGLPLTSPLSALRHCFFSQTWDPGHTCPVFLGSILFLSLYW